MNNWGTVKNKALCLAPLHCSFFWGSYQGLGREKLAVEDRMSTALDCTIDVSFWGFSVLVKHSRYLGWTSCHCTVQGTNNVLACAARFFNHSHCHSLPGSIALNVLPKENVRCYIQRLHIFGLSRGRRYILALNLKQYSIPQLPSDLCHLSSPRGRWGRASEISSLRSNSGISTSRAWSTWDRTFCRHRSRTFYLCPFVSIISFFLGQVSQLCPPNMWDMLFSNLQQVRETQKNHKLVLEFQCLYNT